MNAPADIIGAYSACAILGDDVLRGLAHEGVDLARLWRRWQRHPHLEPRYAAVEHLDDGSFEVADGGIGAVIFPAADEVHDIVDLVAWAPLRPPARWLCRAGLLGGENVLAPRLKAGLRVEPDVLTWLRHGCQGVVVLDEHRARRPLYRAAPLEVATVAEGQALRRMLEVKPPEILVPSSIWRAGT